MNTRDALFAKAVRAVSTASEAEWVALLSGKTIGERHADRIHAADKLDAAIDTAAAGIAAWARDKPSWGEVLALPENRVPAVRDLQAEAAAREAELLANIYDGEPEFLIAAMQADVVVARTVLAIVNNVQKLTNNACIPAPYNLGDQISHAIAEYVERTA